VFITHDGVLVNVAYKNCSDINSNTLTGYIKCGILTPVMKEITFIASVIQTDNTLWKVLYIFIRRQ
jgi:hypothetical protein